MTDSNSNSKNTSGINPILAGVVGVGIGAAAGAAAVILSDEGKRKDLQNAVGDMKDKAVEVAQSAKSTAQDRVEKLNPAAQKPVKKGTAKKGK